MEAELLIDCANTLGECIRWNPADGRIYWTDIQECLLYTADPDGANVKATSVPERLSSFAFCSDGSMICAFESGIFYYDQAARFRVELASFERENADTRTNDGCCDRQGRFVFGGFDEVAMRPISSLRSVGTADGERLLLDHIGCANSIAFSRSGESMYFTDSGSRLIKRYAYDPRTGYLGQSAPFAHLAINEGIPDGSCIDASDALWNARFGGFSVQRYLPSGELDTRIHLPVPNATSCCFGGQHLDIMFITTARLSMSEPELQRYPEAGGVFIARPGFRGLVDTTFQR